MLHILLPVIGHYLLFILKRLNDGTNGTHTLRILIRRMHAHNVWTPNYIPQYPMESLESLGLASHIVAFVHKKKVRAMRTTSKMFHMMSRWREGRLNRNFILLLID